MGNKQSQGELNEMQINGSYKETPSQTNSPSAHHVGAQDARLLDQTILANRYNDYSNGLDNNPDERV